MTTLFTCATAVERLATYASSLPPEFAKAVGDDLEYARFGAVLGELPRFGGSLLAHTVTGAAAMPPATFLFRTRRPVSFGIKAAELVANGALVGRDAGLAFVAGYFTQLCVQRALHALNRGIAARRGLTDERSREWARLEWAQSLYLMEELHGAPLLGTAAVRAKLRVRKGTGAAGFSGVGRGLYEIVRVCCQDSWGHAPPKSEVDRWVLGLHAWSLTASTPVGRLWARQALKAEPSPEVYRGAGVDVWTTLESALETTRQALAVISNLIRRGSFSSRARAKVLEVFPDVRSDPATQAAVPTGDDEEPSSSELVEARV